MAGRKTFVDLDVLTAAEVNGYLMDQAVMSFATAAARDAAIPAGQRKPGMVTHAADTGLITVYQTIGAWSGWAPLPGALVVQLRHTTTGSMANGVSTPLPWDAEDFDLLAGHSSSDASYVGKVPGWYVFSGCVSFSSNTAGYRQVGWLKNNSPVNGGTVQAQPVTGAGTIVAAKTTAIYLNGTTDYVTLAGYQNSTVALTALGTSQQPMLTAVYAGP